MTGTTPDITLVHPAAAMVSLTAVVWVYMYSLRIPYVQRNKKLMANVKTRADGEKLPGWGTIAAPSDNLMNLFEMPVLFYLLVALQTAGVGRIDGTQALLAWLFVAGRVGHSFVHCTFNNIPVRFTFYASATMCLFAMWARFYLGLVL